MIGDEHQDDENGTHDASEQQDDAAQSGAAGTSDEQQQGEQQAEQTYTEEPGDREALDKAKKIAEQRGGGTPTRERSSAVDAVAAAQATQGHRGAELNQPLSHEEQAARASGEAMAPGPSGGEQVLHREGRRDRA